MRELGIELEERRCFFKIGERREEAPFAAPKLRSGQFACISLRSTPGTFRPPAIDP
jgi:hypothetical protein